MKTILFLALTAPLIFGCTKTDDDINIKDDHPAKPVTLLFKEEKKPVIKGFNGHYITYPSNHEKTSEPLPVLIYLHGLGQKGKGNSELGLLGEDGLGKLMKTGRLPLYFKGNEGKDFSFITISPQWSEKPDAKAINNLIKYLSDNFNIDSRRIYLAGISAGSIALSEIIVGVGHKIAAFVPIAGVSRDSEGKISRAAAENNLPVWAFHNEADTVVPYTWTENYVQNINNLKPQVKAKLTKFNLDDHDAWTRALDPGFNQDGLNIYEWLLQYSKR